MLSLWCRFLPKAVLVSEFDQPVINSLLEIPLHRLYIKGVLKSNVRITSGPDVIGHELCCCNWRLEVSPFTAVDADRISHGRRRWCERLIHDYYPLACCSVVRADFTQTRLHKARQFPNESGGKGPRTRSLDLTVARSRTTLSS